MAKFYGPIGYAVSTEIRPGVWVDGIEEHMYYGDEMRNTVQSSPSQDSTIDEIAINNQISIVADPFAMNHFHSMKYVGWMGTKWKIKSVEPKYPRLILSVGGIYNGPTEIREA